MDGVIRGRDVLASLVGPLTPFLDCIWEKNK